MRVTLTVESNTLGHTTLTTHTNSYTTDPETARGTLRALINDTTRKAARAYELNKPETEQP